MNEELIASARASIATSLATSYLLRLADALEAAQPAPQVPMTNDEITKTWRAVLGHSGEPWQGLHPWVFEVVRAIEAHHKIGVKP